MWYVLIDDKDCLKQANHSNVRKSQTDECAVLYFHDVSKDLLEEEEDHLLSRLFAFSCP